MSEGQRWLVRFHTETVLMHYDTVRWLDEGGVLDAFVMPPANLLEWWQRSGQWHNAVAHIPNTVPPPYVWREQINAKPPALPLK